MCALLVDFFSQQLPWWKSLAFTRVFLWTSCSPWKYQPLEIAKKKYMDWPKRWQYRPHDMTPTQTIHFYRGIDPQNYHLHCLIHPKIGNLMTMTPAKILFGEALNLCPLKSSTFIQKQVTFVWTRTIPEFKGVFKCALWNSRSFLPNDQPIIWSNMIQYYSRNWTIPSHLVQMFNCYQVTSNTYLSDLLLKNNSSFWLNFIIISYRISHHFPTLPQFPTPHFFARTFVSWKWRCRDCLRRPGRQAANTQRLRLWSLGTIPRKRTNVCWKSMVGVDVLMYFLLKCFPFFGGDMLILRGGV